MKQKSILLVDDEKEIREVIRLNLINEGFTIFEAKDATEALKKIKANHPSLIVLDVCLPDLDGVELCRRVRHMTQAPIIFLSCKDSELDKVIGLSVGGDDYIGKPFSMNELVARIKAHLRRYHSLNQEDEASPLRQVLYSSSIALHVNQHECYVQNHPIQLSSKEFQLLHFFMQHPGQVFSAEHLIEQIWGIDAYIDSKTVMVHIGNLRKKLGDNPKQPEVILTIRGTGYKFNETVQVG